MKIISSEREAREAVRKGIDFSEKIVRSTLGPNGKNVLIGRSGVSPFMTNDGATAALETELDNEFENAGCDLIKELTHLASIRLKGGTSTATVLFKAIIDEAFSRIDADESILNSRVSVINVKREIISQCEKVCAAIELKTRPITKDEIYDAALTAGEYPWIAEICKDVLSKIGPSGYVSIVDGPVTSTEIYKGMDIPSGYHSDKFGAKVNLDNTKVLITNEKVSMAHLQPLIQAVSKSAGSSLLVVAPDYDISMVPVLNDLKEKDGFSCIILKLPTFGKTEILEDIAILTEAKFFDKTLFKSADDLLKAMNYSSLGSLSRASISSTNTFLMGGKGDTTKRVEEITALKDQSESALDREKFDQRIASLTGGVAIIRIGAPSETERVYYRKKMEDAINGAQKSLAKGVVKGGGVTLYEVAKELPSNILTKALKVPYEAIQESFGEETKIPDSVIDSTWITVEGLKLVCSLASTFITVGTINVIKREKENDKL